MYEVTIHVKQAHIENGQAYHARRCAVALAIRDYFKDGDEYPTVDVAENGQIAIWKKKVFITLFPVDEETAALFIDAANRGKYVEPIDFTFTFDRSIY